jgi:hypothetical protein
MEKSDSIKNLIVALIKFQSTVGKIKKDSINPFFKSVYASLPDILNSIHQPLIENGLSINQFPTGTNSLTTIISHESGEYMMDTYTMTPAKNDPQGIGSCITYQRRYALGAVLSLNIDEDDDGNSASTPVSQPMKSVVEDKILWLSPESPSWGKAVSYLKEGGFLSDIKEKYSITAENETKLINESK